jgi:hypothetical protein
VVRNICLLLAKGQGSSKDLKIILISISFIYKIKQMEILLLGRKKKIKSRKSGTDGKVTLPAAL